MALHVGTTNRAENGMDAFTVLGVKRDAIKGKADLDKLRQRTKQLRDDFLRKRQEGNAKRAVWAFEQIKREVSKSLSTSEQATNDKPLADQDDSSLPSSKKRKLEQRQLEEVRHQEVARERTAESQSTRATSEKAQSDADKRREIIREKLASKRTCKNVPVVAEKDGKRRVADLLTSPTLEGAGPQRTINFICPASQTRIRTPVRGYDCKHVQCFDLETFVFRKIQRCPVCTIKLEAPSGIFVDGYMSHIMTKVGVNVKEVSFDQSGAWNLLYKSPVAASSEKAVQAERKEPAPKKSVAQEKQSQVSHESKVQVESHTETDTTSPAPKSSEALDVDVPPARVKHRVVQDPQKVAEARKKFQKVVEEPEALVDAKDETNYLVVELSKPMGITFRANPSTSGGIFVESFAVESPAEKHGSLKSGDQLVGVGDTPVTGQSFDECVDKICADTALKTRLTLFRGVAASLYGKRGATPEWISSFMAKVADGTVEVTPPAPEPEPDVPAEKRRKQHRLSIPESDSDASMDSDEDLFFSDEDCEDQLPDSVAECISGAGLDADLEACINCLPELPCDGPQRRVSASDALPRTILKSCIDKNSGEWEDVKSPSAWRKAASKRVVEAANIRFERFEASERQKKELQRKAALEAAELELRKTVALLKVDPDKILQFSSRSGAAQLMLRNSTPGFVAFRIRTSAPPFILVQPTTGTLRQGEHVDVQMISSKRPIPPCNLKFMVQAALAPSGEQMPKEKWSLLEKADVQEWHLVGKR